jgi:serine/threonine protein kinase
MSSNPDDRAAREAQELLQLFAESGKYEAGSVDRATTEKGQPACAANDPNDVEDAEVEPLAVSAERETRSTTPSAKTEPVALAATPDAPGFEPGVPSAEPNIPERPVRRPAGDEPTTWRGLVADPTAALEPGDPDRVGPYILQARLGTGGMSTVYLAEDSNGQRVALKLLRPDLSKDDVFIRRFHREVAAARRVAGFCTARVLGANLEGQQPYLVTEYVEGVRLDRLIERQGPLPPTNLHALAVGVATALAAIHAANLVHRDLKASNVILSYFGPRVIDFGIARALDVNSQVTRGNITLGTPGWMAPEQLAGKPPSPATDVFTWGALMTYAATGRFPFGAGNHEEVAFRIINGQPDLEGLEGPVRQIIERALEKDPDRRPTAKALLLALLSEDPRAVLDEDPEADITQIPQSSTRVAAERQAATASATDASANSSSAPSKEAPPEGEVSPEPGLPGSPGNTVPIALIPGPTADKLASDARRRSRVRRQMGRLLTWLTSLGAVASAVDFRNIEDHKVLAVRLVILLSTQIVGFLLLPRLGAKRARLVISFVLASVAGLLVIASILVLTDRGRVELFNAGIAGALALLLLASWTSPSSTAPEEVGV